MVDDGGNWVVGVLGQGICERTMDDRLQQNKDV